MVDRWTRVKHKVGSVMAYDQIKQNLMDVCKTQSKMGWYGKLETVSDFVVHNKLESVRTTRQTVYWLGPVLVSCRTL